MNDDWPEYLPDVRAACDIGCDEYGYPIRPAPVPVSPAGLAAGTVPNTPPITARALFCRGVKIGLR